MRNIRNRQQNLIHLLLSLLQLLFEAFYLIRDLFHLRDDRRGVLPFSFHLGNALGSLIAFKAQIFRFRQVIFLFPIELLEVVEADIQPPGFCLFYDNISVF